MKLSPGITEVNSLVIWEKYPTGLQNFKLKCMEVGNGFIFIC